METESKRYSQMLKDVEGLMGELSSNDLDLDLMVTKVEKGFELIQALRGRLEETKSTIENLKDRFEEKS
jgi:exodeoxyribonuclease VII small subunit